MVGVRGGYFAGKVFLRDLRSMPSTEQNNMRVRSASVVFGELLKRFLFNVQYAYAYSLYADTTLLSRGGPIMQYFHSAAIRACAQ